jgi:hypothetical protein
MASQLILILRDFFPAADPPTAASMLPRLAGLETLLSAADAVPMPHGWRDEFSARFATAASATLSPAAVVALGFRAAEVEAGRQHWLATPVHYFAGLDSVRLHPAGLLDLPALTQAALAEEFNAVFADSVWRLRTIGRRELLLSGAPLAASGADPAASIGADLRDGLPRGAAGATLRRLGVEIEMWLHEHRLNRERQARGELPVTALWSWGASAPVARESRAAASGSGARSAELLGEECYAEALWRLRGDRSAPLPERFEPEVHGETSTRIVLYPTLSAESPNGAFERLEQQWLSPALQALRARRLSLIELLAGTRRFRLRRLHLARFWRARAPWWQALA